MWQVSTDPLRFEEAVDWFHNRVPLTRAEWDRLQERAKRRAFTVSGVAQTRLVEDVYGELLKAVESGTDFRDFKKAVGEQLEAAWGKKDAHRLETVFRTNLQSAYAAGRYRQLTDPDVLKTRPFWMFDSVLDSRTSGVCRQLNGTVRPADDPFWDTHTPPLHFNCRSGLRSLTRAQAEARGVTETPPNAPPASGFGSRPDPEAWGRDWAKGVVQVANQATWEPAFLGEPPGPADYGLPERLTPAPMPVALLPSESEVGAERFTEILRDTWGALDLNLMDPTRSGIVISEEGLLGHILGKEGGRERFLSLLPDLVTNPQEIWLTPVKNSETGVVVFRKRYIKVYEYNNRRTVLLSAEQHRGVWSGLTFFDSRSNSTLRSNRVGFLRYSQ